MSLSFSNVTPSKKSDHLVSTNGLSTLSTEKVVWVVNPFDLLPNESDVELRYRALCRTFAERQYKVIWWSSDFSHVHKKKRSQCPDSEGFSIRLIETTPYRRNVSLARLKNHKQFAKRFYSAATRGIKDGSLALPDRIVVSVPPLGIAEQAFRIRDFVNSTTRLSTIGDRGPEVDNFTRGYTARCTVIVDIMDAWPETFSRIIPRPLRSVLSPLLFAKLHRSAARAYMGADKISAVGESYLKLAQQYLSANVNGPRPPTHLCFHGTNLTRFRSVREQKSSSLPETRHSRQTPLKAIYLGSMETGYDLMTIVKVAAHWKSEGSFPIQIHFAGAGSQSKKLKNFAARKGLLDQDASQLENEHLLQPNQFSQHPITGLEENREPQKRRAGSVKELPRVVFHGYLQQEAINTLLSFADIAIVPNRPESLVAVPYKAAEYAASGLPMISCLGGEFGELLAKFRAGSEYKEGNVESLRAAFRQYIEDPKLISEQSDGAFALAKELFDRKITYPSLVNFIAD